MLAYNDKLYVVIDNFFYECTQGSDGVTLTATLRGTLPVFPPNGPVKMVTNGTLGNQIMIVDGVNMYYYDIITLTFAVVDDGGAGTAAATVAYQDGYGIYENVGTNQWFITQLSDFSTVSPLDYESTVVKADKIVNITAYNQYVFIFTETGTEVWYNSGTTDLDGTEITFPFSRVSQYTMDQGCAAPHSVVKMDQSLFWLSASERGEGYICRNENLTPKVISTPAINNQIASYDTISDAIAFSYQNNGHEFYVITFPSADRTWAYDVSTGLWHERRSAYVSSPSTGTIQGRHRANCYAYLNGVHYVGDYASGKIYQMTSDAYDEDGTAILRERTSPHIHEEQKKINCYRLELDIARGIGVQSGQGSNPLINLSISKDGGRTFLDRGDRSMGAQGAYTTRAQWTMLGQARDWVFRIRVSDPVEHVIMNGILDFEVTDG
jgi:hypothetical protein